MTDGGGGGGEMEASTSHIVNEYVYYVFICVTKPNHCIYIVVSIWQTNVYTLQ